ncbi:MAG: type II secretion system protein [Bdellovibrio sp.]
MKRIASNNKGFTIVEVLIAIGIMGIVSLGIAEMFRQMAEQQRNVVQLMNKQDLKSTATIAVRDKGGCTNTLTGMLIPTTVAGATSIAAGIKDNQGNVIVTSAGANPTRIGNAAGDWLQVTNIRFFSTTPNVPFTRKAATIRVQYNRAKANGTITEGLDIPISVVPDAAGKVSLCYGYDFTDDNICSTNGGTFNPMTGVCDYTKLCVNGNCVTTFSTQTCPQPGQPSTFRTMVGMKNGLIMCGPSDHKVW